MSEPPTVEGPRTSTLVAVVLGAVIGILGMLLWLPGLSVGELGVVLVPLLVASTMGGAAFLWAKRRGDL